MKNPTSVLMNLKQTAELTGLSRDEIRRLAEAGLIRSIKTSEKALRKFVPSLVKQDIKKLAAKQAKLDPYWDPYGNNYGHPLMTAGEVVNLRARVAEESERERKLEGEYFKEPTLVEVKPAESKVEAIAAAALGEAPARPSFDENFDQGIVMYVKIFPQSIINEYVFPGFWVRVQNSMAVLYSRSEMTAEDAAMALSAVLCEDGGWRDGFVLSLTRWSNMSLVPLTKLRSKLQIWLERGVVEEEQSTQAHPANVGDDCPRLFRFKRPGHQTVEWRNYGA